MRVVAITNQKGGVGKTTTAVNGAAALAEIGRRVLAIDLDPQAQCSEHVGMRQDEDSPVYHVLARGRRLEDYVRPTAYGFDLLAGGDDVAIAQSHMSAAVGGRGRHVLKEALAEVTAGRWDVVLLDCPPSLGELVYAALIAADGVLVPLPLQAMPLDGVRKLLRFVREVKRYENPDLVLDAIIATNTNEQTNLAVYVRDALEAECGPVFLPQAIRINTDLAKAFAYQKPVLSYAPKSNGAADYRALALELVERGIA